MLKVITILAVLMSEISLAGIILGDSIFALTGQIEDLIEVDSGKVFDSFAKNGAKVRRIRAAYNDFKATGNRTDIILMNGGGNDVLRNWDCYFFNDDCRILIADAVEVLAKMLKGMENDGVNQVYFLGYYKLNLSARLNEAILFGSEKIEFACSQSSICHYIDPIEKFLEADKPISNDSVHPSDEGYQILADLILELL